MEFHFHLIGVIMLNAVFGIRMSTGELTAVSTSLIMSRYYMNTRNRQPKNSLSEVRKPLDSIAKNTLCHFIGSSGYFRMEGYESVDMPPILLQNETIDVYIVHTRKTVSEDVFPCMVVSRSEDDTTAFKFYISGEYDMGIAMVNQTERVPGRFLFVYENDMFYCDALAEEPASTFPAPNFNVQQLYSIRKSGQEIAQSKSRDPLCRQNLEKKLRICTIIMNSPDIAERGIIFFPDSRNVRSVCQRRWVREDRNTGHEEWMIACVAKRVSDDVRVEYYLSRAYDHNQVFVYTVHDEKTAHMNVESLRSNVRYIFDTGTQISVKDRTWIQ